MDYTVHGILQARILEWVRPSLLQGIFPTQESNKGLLHCMRILYQLSYEGSPYTENGKKNLNIPRPILLPCSLCSYSKTRRAKLANMKPWKAAGGGGSCITQVRPPTTPFTPDSELTYNNLFSGIILIPILQIGKWRFGRIHMARAWVSAGPEVTAGLSDSKPIQPRWEEKEGRDRGGGESAWTDHQVCASLASRGGGGWYTTYFGGWGTNTTSNYQGHWSPGWVYRKLVKNHKLHAQC